MAATPTSDRECTPLTACGDGEYESEAATPTSDRSCAALTICSPTQGAVEEVAEDGSATEDRRCCLLHVGNLSVGDDDEWPAWNTDDEACVVIDGPLRILGSVPPAPLPVAAVWGLMTIWYTDLENLSMSSELVEVRGVLGVAWNEKLVGIGELSSLKAVGSNLLIDNNPSLTHIEGFPALTTVGSAHYSVDPDGNVIDESWSGSVEIQDNIGLVSIDAFPVLEQLAGVRVMRNPLLTHLGGFDMSPSLMSTQYPGGGIYVEDNNSLCHTDSEAFAYRIEGSPKYIRNNGADAVCD